MNIRHVVGANPGASYLSRRAEINEVVASVLSSGSYILGKSVTLFEAEFARYVGVRHSVGLASGTDAILLALKACGVGPGDTVVTVSHTATATVAAIVMSGARALLVDIDEGTFTMDLGHLESTLSHSSESNIKAVVPVHLYGNPVDVQAILRMCEKQGIFVVEDCAQAHGAKIGGRMVGGIGDLGAFSFYPTKNLGAFGDGGATVTDNAEMHDRIMMLRQYGWRERYISEIPGMNSRLDEIQAGILQLKLRYLDEDNSRRRSIAEQYQGALSGSSLVLPRVRDDCYHVYHQYVVRTPRRDSLKTFLAENNISTSILYPQPIHLQSGYAPMITIDKEGLSNTEKVAKDLLCLPIYPELSDQDVSYVCEMILRWQMLESSKRD